ncbi:hypothetical protein PPL_10653 [Heterostelium album PN500]|uniref:Right handed beta helix domain-containing protein n=1 Tax=Heterostelium pallidum (strain ATCC 26659 / Pp 5 / PN500) TaxID=670386 RepID=D3BRP2_HETP5|nr:hypothetical protein PPL_10653 [Heterostelium album PN500]EFA76074.1 hypothetical protein PPL_10653 [Heterostelium album PN500]|eukprot:XP_020428208.1 hypothetical protein PPL_10653 [Heterostelium album PN500]
MYFLKRNTNNLYFTLFYIFFIISHHSSFGEYFNNINNNINNVDYSVDSSSNNVNSNSNNNNNIYTIFVDSKSNSTNLHCGRSNEQACSNLYFAFERFYADHPNPENLFLDIRLEAGKYTAIGNLWLQLYGLNVSIGGASDQATSDNVIFDLANQGHFLSVRESAEHKLQSTYVRLYNLTIVNAKQARGSVLYIDTKSKSTTTEIYIDNCSFNSNQAMSEGGVIYAINTSVLSITSSSFNGNLAKKTGSALYVENIDTFVVERTEFNQNSMPAIYCKNSIIDMKDLVVPDKENWIQFAE